MHNMVAPISSNTVLNNSQIPSVPAANTATTVSLSSTTTAPTPPAAKKTVSAETERYTAVQQSLANAKSAVTTATKANSNIDESLKKVRDIATQLADDTLATKDRQKLQTDYQQLREGIIKSQDQATVKNGNQKTNLLKDEKSLNTATNTRGGQLEIQSSQSAKALGLPEKLSSAADAKALLQGDEKQPGSLANAEKSTRDTTVRLKKAEANVDQKLETSTAVAKAVQRLETAKNGGAEVSVEREQQRSQALEKARETSQLLKSQLGGLSQTNNVSGSNSLLSLLR
jgi:flagellin-like hook-associated protein FlgL